MSLAINTIPRLTPGVFICVIYEYTLMSIRNWEAHLEIKGQHISYFKLSNPDELADKLSLDDLQFCDRITLVPVRLSED